MAKFFHGDTEMQGNGDVLQTLILNQHHHLPAPPSAANSQIDYSSGGVAAREMKRGLSLSLSSDEKHAAVPERVRVFGGAEKAALSCKYLKAAQQLLDEVVNVRKEGEKGGESGREDDGKLRNDAEAVAGDGCGKGGAELTTAEKQEIQMKRAKLVDMLHEVEQKYKQYEEQMQKVISWLEEAAGVGCAKTYTASPLETISKQFRSLKDAIMQQIRRRTTNSGPKMEASTFQINSPWRPQRGLPEKSVCVLRAWLFQHFLHPYPKDSDKVMLAKQAGLTRSQVSNWFINARVRLWKPMVEEMYAEEMKAQQQTPKIEHENEGLVDENISSNANNSAGFSLIGSSEMDSVATEWMRSSKKPRNAEVSRSPLMIVSEVESQHVTTITGTPANFFGLYDPIVGIEQFQQPYSRNGVSLTLGLQHCESLSNQSFISSRSVEASAQGNDFVYY
ncbi:BEL1-like homeodomain protein 1 [Salvia hispanica]|uniref:BEL1-like homeodomain protein 1 n=1 Tax=Salvia hispanica TaxID=49212 RepID=UPI0020097A18|nr:BEL1-like homeodomain protein 1 [Salvia hispanica]